MSDSALVLTYGRSGAGKSGDCLGSFPRADFIAGPGALIGAKELWGYVPDKVLDAKTVSAATKHLVEVSKNPNHPDTLVADDFSLLADVSFVEFSQKFKGYAAWNALIEAVMEFIMTARRCGMHVILNAHERPPNNEKGERGGPLLPCKLHEKLPAWCDMVFRTSIDPAKQLGFKGIYRCNPEDASWVTRDRHHRTPDKAPMNLGEILRHAGYTVGRLPECPWQEEIVENAALELAPLVGEVKGLKDLKQLLQSIKDFLVTTHSATTQIITWTLRDAIDRATLRKLSNNKTLSMYGVT